MKKGIKYLSIILPLTGLLSCNPPPTEIAKDLHERVVYLEKELANTYKPGLGEFMSSIQVHHAKLWFAGVNKNWKLADFEIQEIKESLDDIQKFCQDREEVKSIPMLTPAIDSVMNTIKHQNLVSFKSGFTFLTGTCNNCHQSTNHEFNVIQVPEIPPFSNQRFSVDMAH